MLAAEPIFAWIGIGARAGLLVKGNGFGLIGNVVIGILGAGIAGLLAPRVGIHTEFFGGSIVAALVGALILLLLVGLWSARTSALHRAKRTDGWRLGQSPARNRNGIRTRTPIADAASFGR